MTIELNVPWLLCLIFVTLKLCGVIDWSWWIVTAPLWGGVLTALIMAVAIKIYLILKK